ncbi:inositol 1,4,5-trisphosphate receptor-interacting protein [Bombina bombina]|uniref:inositol 1,4,5-trisphosphate receptor-interacting protein n=1 Tax=Bombina bombina TaxID=8345 RepID=UPI00235AA535|nr:inositol 1,4,5-trisphosphate receptor-interacting protein [Bombina bombina]XP_053548752.1 inositol 1,4,5-trisphosphate receptor-interacting protein [Bombina bombina]XP_053548753.1 inositol 1,4,5-trisphosphate receptor-interacting protein [Bombina bombina]XP_053548754.1 inositol 1,4,5-trisphosphate receptor-interacting protein [Bombina bombina]
MQAGIFKVCLVMVTAIVNHPLLFPNENTSLPDSDEFILQKMKEYEENLKINQLKLEQHMSQTESKEQEEKQKENKESEVDDPPWDFWSAMSMVIFLMIEIWRQDFQDGNPQELSKEEDDLQFMGNSCQGVSLPNQTVLAIFSDQYIRVATHDATRTREFVEGFADDLLEALRSLCNRDADMEVEESVCVGSMYENWRVNKPLTCDLIVPFAPPEPFQFKCHLWVTDHLIPPGYGKIRVVGPDDESVGCVCDKTKLGEDMLCLLHNPANKKEVSSDINLLCSKNTNYLDVDQVMKWFQTSVTKAWSKISHKYEFDLSFSHLDSPGALRVKFKSGKVINFNISPVVQFEDLDLYFISHFPTCVVPHVSPSNNHWILSFAVYERRFLKEVAKNLPDSSCHLSCLQIMTFLHSKQCQITGQSGLTSYHLKTVLLHLLLARTFSDWDHLMLEERLQDMFKSLEKCLMEKKLDHFMIGNPRLPHSVSIPENIRFAEPLNLFRSFVLNRDLYQKTLSMFYEMLKNATVLINEYSLNIRAAHAQKNHINHSNM